MPRCLCLFRRVRVCTAFLVNTYLPAQKIFIYRNQNHSPLDRIVAHVVDSSHGKFVQKINNTYEVRLPFCFVFSFPARNPAGR